MATFSFSDSVTVMRCTQQSRQSPRAARRAITAITTRASAGGKLWSARRDCAPLRFVASACAHLEGLAALGLQVLDLRLQESDVVQAGLHIRARSTPHCVRLRAAQQSVTTLASP